jgi:hypothetical protein
MALLVQSWAGSLHSVLSGTVSAELGRMTRNIALMNIRWRSGVEAYIKIRSVLITFSRVPFLKCEKHAHHAPHPPTHPLFPCGTSDESWCKDYATGEHPNSIQFDFLQSLITNRRHVNLQGGTDTSATL